MKKQIIKSVNILTLVIAIMVMSLFVVVTKAEAEFFRNLTVGSSGSDVKVLQYFLIEQGYDIPAISSQVASAGYFGAQTRIALMVYQRANGMPDTGFFGPLAIANINARIAGLTPSPLCPSGYVCTPLSPPVVQCPVGYVCTPIGTSGTKKSDPQINLISSNASAVANSGSNDDVASFKIRFSVNAVNGPVYVSSTTGAGGVSFAIDKSGSIVTSGTSATLVNITDGTLTTRGNYKIEQGQTETFELNGIAQLPAAGMSGLYRMNITSVRWDRNDDNTLDNVSTFNLGSFSTSYIVLN